MSEELRRKMNVRFPGPVMRALSRSARRANRSANEQAVRFISERLIEEGMLAIESPDVPEVLKYSDRR